MQECLVNFDFIPRERSALGVRALCGFDKILLLSGQDASKNIIAFQLLQLVSVVKRGVLIFALGFGVGSEWDLEVEFGEQGTREVGILVAAFEDNAVEFVLGDSNREIGLCFAAGGKTGEEFCVKEGNPDCLGRDAPVEEGKEGSRGVVDAWILRNFVITSSFDV